MDVETYDSLIEEPFSPPDLATLWDDLLARYKNMGFIIPLTDADKATRLSDNEMIAEFTWVHQQYRKYIGKKRGELLQLKYDLPRLMATVRDLIAKDSVVPEDRKTLVYQAMKVQWLNDTWNHFAWVAEQIENEGEENE